MIINLRADDFDQWLEEQMRDNNFAVRYLDELLTDDGNGTPEIDREMLRNALIRIGAANGIDLK